MHMFIVQISLWVQLTVQFTPMILEHIRLQSHILWGEFSIHTFGCSYSQSSQFSFLVPPITAVRQGQYEMRSLSNTSAHNQQWELNPRLGTSVLCPIPFHVKWYRIYLLKSTPDLLIFQFSTLSTWSQAFCHHACKLIILKYNLPQRQALSASKWLLLSKQTSSTMGPEACPFFYIP